MAESGRPTAVLLTAPWHERSARCVTARYDARAWIHPHGRARVEDLPELEVLPNGVEVFVPAGVDEGQVAFHIVPEQALVVAEFFLGTDSGLRVLPSPGTRDWAAFAASLDQLRHLSIERVLLLTDRLCWNGARTRFALLWTPSRLVMSANSRGPVFGNVP